MIASGRAPVGELGNHAHGDVCGCAGLHVLPIQAQKLLTVTQHSEFSGGAALRKPDDRARVDIRGGAQAQKVVAGGIFTDHAGETDLGAQRGNLACDVRGASEPVLRIAHPHHGYGRFR